MAKLPHQKIRSQAEDAKARYDAQARKHNQQVAYWATLYQASPGAISSPLKSYPDICEMVHAGFKARRAMIGVEPKPGEFEREVKTEYERRELAAKRVL